VGLVEILPLDEKNGSITLPKIRNDSLDWEIFDADPAYELQTSRKLAVTFVVSPFSKVQAYYKVWVYR
jgi:hypothetical protein